jgi:hypothetical protein
VRRGAHGKPEDTKFATQCVSVYPRTLFEVNSPMGEDSNACLPSLQNWNNLSLKRPLKRPGNRGLKRGAPILRCQALLPGDRGVPPLQLLSCWRLFFSVSCHYLTDFAQGEGEVSSQLATTQWAEASRFQGGTRAMPLSRHFFCWLLFFSLRCHCVVG